jgi:hypothetical protein
MTGNTCYPTIYILPLIRATAVKVFKIFIGNRKNNFQTNVKNAFVLNPVAYICYTFVLNQFLCVIHTRVHVQCV